MLEKKDEAQRILSLLIENNWKVKLKDLWHTAQYARNYLRKLEIFWNIKKIWLNRYEILKNEVTDYPFHLPQLMYELQEEKEKNNRLKKQLFNARLELAEIFKICYEKDIFPTLYNMPPWMSIMFTDANDSDWFYEVQYDWTRPWIYQSEKTKRDILYLIEK